MKYIKGVPKLKLKESFWNIIFKILFDNEDTLLSSYNAQFLLILNSLSYQTVLFSGLPTTWCKNGGKFKLFIFG